MLVIGIQIDDDRLWSAGDVPDDGPHQLRKFDLSKSRDRHSHLLAEIAHDCFNVAPGKRLQPHEEVPRVWLREIASHREPCSTRITLNVRSVSKDRFDLAQ